MDQSKASALAPRRARLVPRGKRAAAATVLGAGQAAQLTLRALGQLGSGRGAADRKPRGVDEAGAALLRRGGRGAASE